MATYSEVYPEVPVMDNTGDGSGSSPPAGWAWSEWQPGWDEDRGVSLQSKQVQSMWATQHLEGGTWHGTGLPFTMPVDSAEYAIEAEKMTRGAFRQLSSNSGKADLPVEGENPPDLGVTGRTHTNIYHFDSYALSGTFAQFWQRTQTGSYYVGDPVAYGHRISGLQMARFLACAEHLKPGPGGRVGVWGRAHGRPPGLPMHAGKYVPYEYEPSGFQVVSKIVLMNALAIINNYRHDNDTNNEAVTLPGGAFTVTLRAWPLDYLADGVGLNIDNTAGGGAHGIPMIDNGQVVGGYYKRIGVADPPSIDDYPTTLYGYSSVPRGRAAGMPEIQSYGWDSTLPQWNATGPGSFSGAWNIPTDQWTTHVLPLSMIYPRPNQELCFFTHLSAYDSASEMAARLTGDYGGADSADAYLQAQIALRVILTIRSPRWRYGIPAAPLRQRQRDDHLAGEGPRLWALSNPPSSVQRSPRQYQPGGYA